MRSRHNYGISMDLLLPDGKEVHLFHENVVHGNLISHYKASLNNKNMAHVVIMCGIPTAGKSTWIKNNLLKFGYRVISRDIIRWETYGDGYHYSTERENNVTRIYNKQLDEAIAARRNIVLDNTHCREKYLTESIKRFDGVYYDIFIKFLDIPLWKAYLRNIKRYAETGVWIPISVIRNFNKSYKQLNKKKYAKYEWKD